jgi:hypothetical protein
MKKVKRLLLAVTLIASFVFSAQSALAATSVAYWSFSGWTTNNGAYLMTHRMGVHTLYHQIIPKVVVGSLMYLAAFLPKRHCT